MFSKSWPFYFFVHLEMLQKYKNIMESSLKRIIVSYLNIMDLQVLSKLEKMGTDESRRFV